MFETLVLEAIKLVGARSTLLLTERAVRCINYT